MQVKGKKIAEMIKKLIFPTLILLIVWAFYLLNAEIAKILMEIEKQETQIEEQQTRIDSQKNVLLFQGARLRDLENRIGKFQIKEYARYK